MKLYYCPFPDEESAIKFAQILLENKIIACANIISSMTSLYEWQGEIKKEKECLLILKTRENFFSKIEKYLKDHHPYEIPCLLEIPMDKVNSSFLSWLHSKVEIASNF